LIPFSFANRVSSGYNWIWAQVCTFSKKPPTNCSKRKKRKTKNKKENRRKRGKNSWSNGKARTIHRQRKRGSWPGSARQLYSEIEATAQCEDTDELFDIGNGAIDRDCSWLASNRELNGEDLCDYRHVSFRCPKTCEECEQEVELTL